MRSVCLHLLCNALLIVGCGRSRLAIDLPGDAGVDGSLDASIDASIDAAIDTPLDTGVDASTDAFLDAGSDAYDAGDASCPDHLVVERRWPSPEETTDERPLGTPMVAELVGGGAAEVVFLSSDGDEVFVRIVDFEGGDHRRIPLGRIMSAEIASTLAVGDVDGDGRQEIVVVGSSGWPGASHRRKRRIAALEADGTIDWIFVDPEWTWGIFGAASIVDLEGDGRAEVVLGSTVLDGPTGELVWRGSIDGSAGVGVQLFLGPQSCVGDLDGDGRQEVVAGNTLFEADGTLRWHAPADDGFCALGDMLPEPGLEVALISDGFVRILDPSTGEVLWFRQLEGLSRPPFGRAPSLADFDGDGLVELAVPVAHRVMVVDPTCVRCVEDGVLANLEGDGSSGASAFDFNLDGVPEIALADSRSLRVVEVRSGRFDRPRYRHLAHVHSIPRYPVIADVDADGEAEIVSIALSLAEASPVSRIVVLGHASHGWPAARPSWNQHAFQNEQIDEAGRPVVRRWSNTYRAAIASPREGAGTCVAW